MNRFIIPVEKRYAYLEQGIKEISLLQQMEAASDLKIKELALLLHKIKGSAHTFGFGDLGELAASLEKKICDEGADQNSPDTLVDELLEKLETCKRNCS